MKKLLLIAFLVVGFLGVSAQKVPAKQATIKKITAKELKTLIDTSTGPMIVNFWATWCGPCIREIPWFDSVLTEKKWPAKLLLVSLDFAGAYPKELAAFVKKQGYKGEVVWLNETSSDYFIPAIEPKWTGAIPASIFVNNSKKYYQMFNQQMPKQRFALELDKLVN